ncbi:hypothetical protein Q9L58_001509 [Maublancomyces gigas]|uniref:Uncharacterized protein n=1 Tax=Discina gigas TaxID=1032678 RepID=A0ABR3GU87_9PEZI
MGQQKIPPFEVNIFLRFRFSRQCRPCCFSRARPANCQLDIELIRPVAHRSDIQELEDLKYNPVGFVVDGRLYTDDEPYWECLLEEGKTYNVAYLKQPFGFSAPRMHDPIFRVLVLKESQVPSPNPDNCTASRKALVIKSGLINKEEKRGYRRTLSDAADREYGAWKSIPKFAGREGQVGWAMYKRYPLSC